MEVGVKKVINSFQNFISETKLSSHVSVSVDWDAVAKDLPDVEAFNKELAILANDLKSLTSKQDGAQEDSSSQSTMPSQSSSSAQEGIVIKEEPTASDARIDPMFVQISASNSEIKRRIQAFIDKKQMEVDDINVREFGSHQEESTCARTDAQFTCRSGTRSHVKVSKVVNLQGPQTRPAMIHHLTSLIQSPSKKAKPVPKSPLSSSYQGGIEERMRNMESHLKIRKGHGSADIYDRLKTLENRILHLESVSPEYLDVVNTFHKRRRLDMGNPGPGNEFSIKEIDHRIQQLQESLLKKRGDFV